MDIERKSDTANAFATGIGLITSRGPFGDDIMACEWTHHVSYKPGLIVICIGEHDATYENIMFSKEFGVNIADGGQNILSSVSGGSSGKEVDKVALLKEMGFEFFKAQKIKALMVKGAVANIECKLSKHERHGDHIMIFGEALNAVSDSSRAPLIYIGGKYWSLDKPVPRPSNEMIDRIASLRKKHAKKT